MGNKVRPYTDTGNAERFVKDHGDMIRFCHKNKNWYIWSGRHWEVDQSEIIVTKAIETTQRLYEQAVLRDTSEGNSITKKAEQQQTLRKIQSMILLARTDPKIIARLEDFDNIPYYLNCLNGVVDLRTGELVSHDKEHMSTHLVEIEYDVDARSAIWDNVIEEIFLGNVELTSWMQKAAGYSITGSPEEQKFFICYGPTASNGKSTFLHGVKTVLGSQLGQQADFSTFRTSNKKGGASPEIVRMRNARMIVAAEGEEGKKLSEQVIKVLTGNESLVGRELYKDYVEFKAKGKMWLSSNHLPKIDGIDEGMWRRVLVIPFKRTFKYEEQDRKIFQKLEQPEVQQAILAWCVKGAMRWYEAGELGECEDVKAATSEYKRSQLDITDFVETQIDLNPEKTCSKKNLYLLYKEWCANAATDPVGKKKFNTQIASIHGVGTKPMGGGYPHWTGLTPIITLED